MTLSVKGLALTSGILWGVGCFLIALVNQIWPPYGDEMLALMGSLYPGYREIAGFGSVLVITFYALVDGAIGGAVFAWLYNKLADRPHAAAT